MFQASRKEKKIRRPKRKLYCVNTGIFEPGSDMTNMMLHPAHRILTCKECHPAGAVQDNKFRPGGVTP